MRNGLKGRVFQSRRLESQRRGLQPMRVAVECSIKVMGLWILPGCQPIHRLFSRLESRKFPLREALEVFVVHVG